MSILLALQWGSIWPRQFFSSRLHVTHVADWSQDCFTCSTSVCVSQLITLHHLHCCNATDDFGQLLWVLV